MTRPRATSKEIDAVTRAWLLERAPPRPIAVV